MVNYRWKIWTFLIKIKFIYEDIFVWIQEEYENRLQQALEELREVYDKQMLQSREDFAKIYDDRVRFFYIHFSFLFSDQYIKL